MISEDEESYTNDLEVIEAENGEIVNEDVDANAENADQNSAGENDGEQEESRRVKPKRIVRNPQPKLNEETLRTPRGLSALESYFDRVKFKGKGHEEEDLNVLLKTYEYWCHRLFPKFPFDACIEKIEKLGTKRGTQTQIKRMRMGMDNVDNPIIPDDDDDDDDDHHHHHVVEQSQNNLFDDLIEPSLVQTPVELSEEQQERIRLNRERAEKLRQERLRQTQESQSNPGSSQPSQNEDLPQSSREFVPMESQDLFSQEATPSNETNLMDVDISSSAPSQKELSSDEEDFGDSAHRTGGKRKLAVNRIEDSDSGEDDIDSILQKINSDGDDEKITVGERTTRGVFDEDEETDVLDKVNCEEITQKEAQIDDLPEEKNSTEETQNAMLLDDEKDIDDILGQVDCEDLISQENAQNSATQDPSDEEDIEDILQKLDCDEEGENQVPSKEKSLI